MDNCIGHMRQVTSKMKYAPKRLRKAKLGGFYKLLFRWKGSVYKLLWREALVFLFSYAIVSLVYRFALNETQKTSFEAFCIYAEEFTSMTPISFVLGFYVSIIVQRWWDQFLSIPWPDKLAYDIAANVHGTDEEARMLRRTMIRYINLGALLTYCTVSKSVKKRFPSLDYVVTAEELSFLSWTCVTQTCDDMFVDGSIKQAIRNTFSSDAILSEFDLKKMVATGFVVRITISREKEYQTNRFYHKFGFGFMTEEEKRVYLEIPSDHPKHWLPCAWFINLVRKAVDDNRIKSAPAAKTIIDDLNQFHDNCDDLYGFDWVTIPLVYTQVVTIAVYTFFCACLFGRQYLQLGRKSEQMPDGIDYPSSADIQRYNVDYYFPAFTMLQFLFYFGWLKVAENLMNPFGEDDDDFEMNWVVDRNLQVSYLIVDHIYNLQMPLVKDIHYDIMEPEIPHTEFSFKTKTEPWMGSAFRVRMSKSDMSISTEGNRRKNSRRDYDDDNYARRRTNSALHSEMQKDEEIGQCDEFIKKDSPASPSRRHSNEMLSDAMETEPCRRSPTSGDSPRKTLTDFALFEEEKQPPRSCTVTSL